MKNSKILKIETSTWDSEEYRQQIIMSLLSLIKAPFSDGKSEMDEEETTRFWFALDLLARLVEQSPPLNQTEIQD